jgi:hypothetical protein
VYRTERHAEGIEPQLIPRALSVLDIFTQLLLNREFRSCHANTSRQ